MSEKKGRYYQLYTGNWEKAYQEYDTVAFSIEPDATVTEFEHLINNQSKIFDATFCT